MPKLIACTMLLPILIAGCRQRGPQTIAEYRTVARDPLRDTDRAGRLNAKAVGLLKTDDLAAAQEALKEALKADLFFGPAHNNLGSVYYRQKRFYLAAWEFQYAAQLMPHNPEPRNNLGLIFETVGKLEDAARFYEEALALAPDNPQIIGNLARVYVRTSRRDARTRELLHELILKDERADWIAWARERLTAMGPVKPGAAATRPAGGRPGSPGTVGRGLRAPGAGG